MSHAFKVLGHRLSPQVVLGRVMCVHARFPFSLISSA